MKFTKLYEFRIKKYEKPFRKLTLTDQQWVTELCAADQGVGGHIHFATMMLCQEKYEFDSFRKFYGCLVKRPWIDDGKLYCQYPIGKPECRKEAVQKIVKLYSHKVKSFVFFGVLENTLAELQELYPANDLEVMNDRDTQEYLLDAAEQISLEGSHFSNKRKKISRFHRTYNWTREKITQDNMAECLEINHRWCSGHEDKAVIERQEQEIQAVLKYYDTLGFLGELYRIDGKAVAYFIGFPFNDKVFLNVSSKADNEYRDATAAFLHEFAKQNCSGYLYINDSCDLGVPGLRTFKTNLHPIQMIPSYFVTVSFQ